jgi:hypothetical protein
MLLILEKGGLVEKMTFRISFDQALKTALENRFKQMLQIFWVDMYDYIDWSYELEYLNKEFPRQSLSDEEKGQIVDSLVKVKVFSEETPFVILHTEIQAQKDVDMMSRMSRMFRYQKCVESRYRDIPVQQNLILADTDPFYRPDFYTLQNKPFVDIKIPVKTVKILDYYNQLTYDNVHLEQKNIAYFFILLILDGMFIGKHNQPAVFNAKKSLLEAMDRCGHREEDIRLVVLVASFVLVLRDLRLSEKWKEEVSMQKQLGSNAVKWFVNEEFWSFKEGKAEGKAEGVVEHIAGAFSGL